MGRELSNEELLKIYDENNFANLLMKYGNENQMIKKLSKRFQKDGCIKDLDDFLTILFWKTNNRSDIVGRTKRALKDKLKEDSNYLIEKTREAFNADTVLEKIKLLDELDGVGVPVASAILMFYDPERFTIIDRLAWAALHKDFPAEFKERKKYKNKDLKEFTADDYKLLNEKCLILAKSPKKLRELDKILWSRGWQIEQEQRKNE